MTTNTINNTVISAAVNKVAEAIAQGVGRYKAASIGQWEIIQWHRARGRQVMSKVAFALLEEREDVGQMAKKGAELLAKAGDQANSILAVYAAGLQEAKIRGWNAPEVHAVTLRVPTPDGAVWKGFNSAEEILEELNQRGEEEWSYDAGNAAKAKLHAVMAELVKEYRHAFGGGYSAFPMPQKKGTWSAFMSACFYLALRVGKGGAERCMRLAESLEKLNARIKRAEAETSAAASNHYIELDCERAREMQVQLDHWQALLEDPRSVEALNLMGLFNKAQRWGGSSFQLTLEVAEQTTEQQAVALVAGITKAVNAAEALLATDVDDELEAFIKG